MTKSKTYRIQFLIGLSISLSAAGLAAAQNSATFEPPDCKAGENLWLLSAGTQGTQPLPSADVRQPSVEFIDYIGPKGNFRTAKFTGIPKGLLGEAHTLERFSGGGNLGWFSRQWPVPIPITGYDTSDLEPLPPRNPPAIGRSLYPSHFSSSRLLDGAQGQTLAQVVSAPDFDGSLTYVADNKAAVDFVAIALCSRALPPKAPPAQEAAPELVEEELVEEEPQAAAEVELAAEIEPEPTFEVETEIEAEAVAQTEATIEAEVETEGETQSKDETTPLEAALSEPIAPLTEELSAAPEVNPEIEAKAEAKAEAASSAAAPPIFQSAPLRTYVQQAILLSAALALSALLNAALQMLSQALSRLMNRAAPPITPSRASYDKNSASSAPSSAPKPAVIFPGSSSFTSDLPQSGAGVSTAYAAVGRIGRRHGSANHKGEMCYGAGVLIAPDKILTNMHIYYFYLHGQETEEIGIEFEAREGSGRSDFIPFKDFTAQYLTGMDAVVMTLERASTRMPIWPQALPQGQSLSDLLGQDIYAIGYPRDPSKRDEAEAIDGAFGEGAIWDVKRWTAGKVLRHEDDISGTDILFDVRARIDPFDLDNDGKTITSVAALCHNATAVGGNSGGAIIAKDTGAFIGLHFGGDSVSANYAVPAHELLRGLSALGLSSPHTGPQTGPQTEAQIGDEIQTQPSPEGPDSPAPIEPHEPHEPISETPTSEVKPPDDLTRIEGIGPKTRDALKAGGITRFSQIAKGSPYDLLPILAHGGLKRRDPTTWPAQAALAAAGEWDTLAEWQAQLHSGREQI